MNLKKCDKHGYTLKEKCAVCDEKSRDAHYKFIKIRNVNGEQGNTEDN